MLHRTVALLVIILSPAPASAARLVSIHVEVRGKPALEGHASDDGYPSHYLVWRYLKTTPLTPAKDFSMPTAAGDPPAVVLKGDIVVRIRYGDDVKANELRLTPAPNGGWLIDAVWVESHGPPGDATEETQRVEATRRAEWLKVMLLVGGALLAGVGVLGAIACIALAAVLRGRRWLRWPILFAFALCAVGAALTLVGEEVNLRFIIFGPAIVGLVLCAFAWRLNRPRRG